MFLCSQLAETTAFAIQYTLDFAHSLNQVVPISSRGTAYISKLTGTIMVTLNRLFSPSYLRSRQALFLLLLLLSGSIIACLMTLFYLSEKNDYLKTVKLQERYALQLQQARIAETFDSLQQDLFFLRDQNELTSLLQNDARQELRLIAREYVTLAKRARMYDQICFLDNRGTEIVRVNYNNGNPEVVQESALQDKSKRYYFTNSLSLDQGEVYVSPFNLNVKNGRTEQPLKPVIRLGTTVANDQGEKQGVVLLKYLGQNLFDKLLAIEEISMGRLMLLNQDGYWLLNQDREKEWGFMYADRQERTLANSDPEVWAAVNKNDYGQVSTQAGLFTFATIRPLELTAAAPTHSQDDSGPANSDQSRYHWTLISLVAQDVLNDHLKTLLLKVVPLAIGVFLISVAGSWMLASSVVKRRAYQEQLKTMAYFDALTGLPNRRHFFDRLEQSIAYKQRYGNDLALMYIDLDGFKQVNDILGHESGDAVLRQTGKSLQNICRKTDILARLGGDEFAVLVPQYTSIEDVALIADKIISTLSTPFDIDGKEARVGASIGIALFPADCKHQTDLLNHADAAMYHAKSLGKNQYIFYNEIPEE